MRIMIAVPCMDMVPVDFASSLLYLDKPPGTSVCFHKNSLIYDSRNLLSMAAIQNKCDAVLWLDSDMTFERDLLTRLIADSKRENVRMVTGLYFTRRIPSKPVIFDRVELPEVVDGQVQKRITESTTFPVDGLFPVAGCGFGCVLTYTSLLKDVWERFGPAFAPFPWAGEDIAFCYRVKQLGDRILCDSGVRAGHIGQYVYTECECEVDTIG